MRVVISPFVFFFLLSENEVLMIVATLLYLIGAVTDFLDGFLARKLKVVSSFGTFLDPLADKFLNCAAFIAFAIMGIASVWMVIVIILRDIITTYMRIIADSIGSPLVTSKTAKWKTFLQMVYICGVLLIILIDSSTSSRYNLMATLQPVLDWTLLALTLLTVWSMTEYIIKNKKIFVK